MSATINKIQPDKNYIEKRLNTVINADCLEVMKKIPDDYFDLIIADFPYFEVKGDFDFIWKTFDEFLKWVELVAIEFERILSGRGSLYVYGHAKKIAYKQIIFDKYFNLENHLVWEKLDCQTKKGIESFRSYAPIKEHILFYSKEVNQAGLELITEEFIKPRNPFARYLRSEFKKANISNKKVAKLFLSKSGNLTGCVSNWLNGDNIMTEEQYLKVREFFNSKYLRKEYKDLRKEYEDLRRPFNNSTFTDVLKFSQEAHITGKYNHPTQKPPKLSKALISTSSDKNTKVFIPFIGSGVEAVECKSLGLDWVGCELDKDYCKIAEDRLKHVQGSLF